MTSHPRPTSSNTFEFSVDLPMPRSFRSAVDLEVESVRRSVIPIIAPDKRQRPVVVGSAVLVAYKGRKVLVTAEHVLSANGNVPLAFFDAGGWSRPLDGEFVLSAQDDLAAKLLTSDETDALRHVPFLPDSVIGRAVPAGQRFYGKRGAVESVGHTNIRDPFGKSGGAIFGLAIEGEGSGARKPIRLVGISTDWKRSEKCIRGPSVAVLVPLLDRLATGTAQSAA